MKQHRSQSVASLFLHVVAIVALGRCLSASPVHAATEARRAS